MYNVNSKVWPPNNCLINPTNFQFLNLIPFLLWSFIIVVLVYVLLKKITSSNLINRDCWITVILNMVNHFPYLRLSCIMCSLLPPNIDYVKDVGRGQPAWFVMVEFGKQIGAIWVDWLGHSWLFLFYSLIKNCITID